MSLLHVTRFLTDVNSIKNIYLHLNENGTIHYMNHRATDEADLLQIFQCGEKEKFLRFQGIWVTGEKKAFSLLGRCRFLR